MHALAQWLDKQNSNQTEFARRVGISPSHLTLILQGKRGVSMGVAKRINVETRGELTLKDFEEVKRSPQESEA